MATPPAFPSFTLVKAVTVPTPSEDQQRQLQRQHAEQLEEADPATYLTHFSKSSQPAWPSVGELIASADSTNGICLFSRQTLDFGGRITGHEDSVTHLSFAKHSPSILWSSSEDGSIRCWDLRTQALAHAFYTHQPVGSFDIGGTDNMILAAGVKENIHFWDLRKTFPGKQQEAEAIFTEVHNEDITRVIFHPCAQNRLFSSSIDGLVCMFDTTTTNEDDSLLAVTPTDKSVESIGFFGNNGAFMFVVSSDQTLGLYNIEQNEELAKLEDARQALSGVVPIDYVINCQYDATNDALFVITGTYGGNMDIFRVETSGIVPMYRLHGGHSGVIRCYDWDIQGKSVITGGEDSKICMWTLA